jgi:Bacterial Ig-like domain
MKSSKKMPVDAGASGRALVALALVAGCAEMEDREPPTLISSSLADGAADVDPVAVSEVTLVFDEPMQRGGARVILHVFEEERELPLRWSGDDEEVAIELTGALLVDRRYQLELDGFADLAGNTMAAPWPSGKLGFATQRVDLQPPEVVISSPAHLEEGVYPAAIIGATAPRVRVQVRFGEPMDPLARAITWGAVGGAAKPAQGTWSEGASVFHFDITAPVLTGQRPLDDHTTYEVELAELRDLAGNPARRAAGDSRLRFTTGQYDALLNHSCGHVAFGPFAAVTAAATAGPQAPRSDAAHTRYTVTLPGVAGEYGGATRLRAAADATWHLFLDRDAPLIVLDEQSQPLPVMRAVTPAACAGISHRVSFSLAAQAQAYLSIGPQTGAEVRFIVEQVAVTEVAQ